MEKAFHMMDFIQKIIAFSPRQLDGEKKTANFIKSFLNDKKIDYRIETFLVDIPLVKEAKLYADNTKVECDGCCMVSGKISHKRNIISSTMLDLDVGNTSNINFNPQCSNAFSKSVHYFAPAVCVKHDGLKKILSAKNVHGSVIIKRQKHESENILVGNTQNPEKVCFAHYDSIETGAIDNASGVSVMMKIVTENPHLLEKNLFVFAGNEELSFDNPTYWGHGFRCFEETHYNLMDRTKKIIIIDSVGNGKNTLVKDPDMLKQGFPIKNIDRWIDKIRFIAGDFNHLMTVYHSKNDDGRGMTEESLLEAYKMFLQELL